MGSAPPPARHRRFRRFAAGFALLLVAVPVAAVYWRLALAGAALRGALDYAGIGGVALTVTQLDGTGATIAGLRAGPALQIESVRLAWNRDHPFRRPLAGVTVSGARLDFTGANAAFWSRLAARDGVPRAPAALAHLAPRLPAVDMEHLVARLPMPGDAVDLALDGTFRPRGGGSVLRVRGRTVDDAVADDAVAIDMSLSLTGLGDRPALSLSGAVSAGLESVVRRARGGLPLAGRMRVELSGVEPLPLPTTPLHSVEDVFASIGNTALNATVFLDGVRWGTQVADVDGRADIVLSLDANGSPVARVRVRLGAGRVAFAKGSAADVRIAGSLSLRLADGELSVKLPAPLAVSAGRAAAGPATLGPVFLAMTGASPAALRIRLADDPPRAVTAALTVESQPVTLRLADDPVPAAPPLAVAGTLRLADDALRFLGQATGLGGALAIAVDAHHDLGRRRGAARLVVDPLRLGPGGVQPSQMVPALTRLAAGGGELGGALTLRWDGSGYGGAARLRLDGLDLADADSGVAVAGLSGVIAFDRLAPPATPPGQVLRLARLDAGVGLNDVTLRFRLGPDAGVAPALTVEALRAGMAGGALSVANGRVGAAGDAALTLNLAGVDLATVFDLVGVEGLGGAGTVDGTIPLVVVGGRVAVAGGRLTARGAGRLRLRSAAVRQALAGAGQEVTWMVQALEDFRYERLSLAVDKPAAGIARLRLETLGHNPAVLQGRPFAINLNLEADVDRIVAGLVDALRLPGRLVGTIVRGSR